MIEVVNLKEKFGKFADQWSPRIAGELNDSYVKLAKIEGEFVWHQHEDEDELFFVVQGSFTMKLRDGDLEVQEGEFVVVPRGVEHMPVAESECWVMLLEPKTTLHTGNVVTERTKTEHEWV